MNDNSRRIVSRRTFWCLCLAAGLLFLGAVFLLSRHADMQDCERRMTELIDFVKEQSSSYVQYNETAVAKALVRGTTAVQEPVSYTHLLFKKYGIPLPTDYDSFVSACQAFAKHGIRGFDADYTYDYTLSLIHI